MENKEDNCEKLSFLFSTYSMLQSSFQDIKSVLKFFVSLLLPVILTSFAFFITVLNELRLAFLTIGIASTLILIFVSFKIVGDLKRISLEMDKIVDEIRKCGFELISEAKNFTKYYYDILLVVLISLWISFYLILTIIRYFLGV